MVAKIVSLFNHKGGVSKTTTTFNLGWAMAELGKKVLVVDADPQCNLTGMALELSGVEGLSELYEHQKNSNLFSCLQPAFGGSPSAIKAATPIATKRDGLTLLAGHIDIATFEPELSMAQKLMAAMPVLQNLPGAIGHLLRATATEHKLDVVLVDLSPSVGAINQNILIQSDYFLVPTSPDFFCLMAIDSLAKTLPSWANAAELIRAAQKSATYKIPATNPKFIGMLSQRYRPRKGKPAAKFSEWIDKIVIRVNDTLVPALSKSAMTIDRAHFEAVLGKDSDYQLAQISDFNSLIAQSQEHATPVFALNDVQLQNTGVILDQMKKSREDFRKTFIKLAEDTIKLIGA